MKKNGRKFGKKNIFLAIAALILVMMTVVSVTYSWIEDVKQVEISTDDTSDNKTPLKAGVDINSKVVIKRGSDSVINLGYVLTDDDIKDNGSIKSGLSPNTAADLEAAQFQVINQKKGYFYESGNMHLSPCYSDGVSFYFPVRGANGDIGINNTYYRLGNKNDENVNYIDYTFDVESPDNNVAFWFKDIPSIQYNNSDIEKARVAITVDGNTKVYSKNGGNDVHTINAITQDSTKEVYSDKFSDYTYTDSADSNDAKHDKVLFSMQKGQTKTVNIKIWVEQGVDVTDATINMSLISSLSRTRDITLVDRTTGATDGSWLIQNNNAKLYLAIPQAYKDNGNQWTENKSYWALTKVQGTEPPEYKAADIPAYYNNTRMFVFRCPSGTGFSEVTYDGNGQPNNRPTNISDDAYKVDGVYSGLPLNNDDVNKAYLDGAPQVWAWNYWSSILPDSFHDEKYTVYAGSLDGNAKNFLNNGGITINATFKGYGTWGPVQEISVINADDSYCAPGLKRVNGSDTYYCNFYVIDYSDEENTGEVYRYTMYYDGTWGSVGNYKYGTWKVFMPITSTKLQFFYYYNYDNTKFSDFWGYNTGVSNNTTCVDTNNGSKQERPEGTSSTTYYLNKQAPDGYWSGSGVIYFVASGNTTRNRAPSVKTYTGSDQETITMEETGNTVNIGGNSCKIYKATVQSKYEKVKFTLNGTTSPENVLKIGKYYYWEDKDWYDSLDSIRDPDSGNSSDGLLESPDGAGTYLYGRLTAESKNYYVKLDSNRSAILYMNVASQYERNLYIVDVDSSNNVTASYKTSGNQSIYLSNSSQQNHNLDTSKSNALMVGCSNAGYYKFTVGNPSNNAVNLIVSFLNS